MNSIEIKNLTKIYRSHVKEEGLKNSITSLFHRKYKEFTAVNDVSFSIEEGELVGMLGANGAGKTTILKMLSGLLTPTSGTATVMNYIPWQRKNDFRRNFSIVMGQRNQLWWDLPAADSFLLNREIYSIPHDLFLKRRNSLAERLDVADKLHVQVRRLSLGERMKCELIAALLHYPKVLFLDEPTIGLDVVAQHSLREFVAEYNKESATTIILTSHYMDDIEHLCKRVIIIDKGKLMFDGALSSLIEEFAAEKMLTIKFTDTVEKHELESMGILTDFTTEKASLRIPRARIATVAGDCLQRFSITDITIDEVPIEDIIRQIFSKK
ncbi:MAG: ABC transporter ATP-binding protein [Bacteroidetes bacterium]|nr:ABC transporter ATP-binding protein [Bacteroidota bacterium]